jgi:hypothetical protein
VQETVEVVPAEVKAEPDLYERIGEERTFEADVTPPKWAPLTAHLGHNITRLGTNAAENAIRPSKLGAKNWLFVGHPDEGDRPAVIYSLVVSCQHDHRRRSAPAFARSLAAHADSRFRRSHLYQKIVSACS